MNPNESWIAEQARLLTMEDGFGPGYAPESGGSSDCLRPRRSSRRAT